MVKVNETALPGVGLRHEFDTSVGSRVAVITHRSGRREILVYEAEDPDAAREVVTLDEAESHTLAELLGGTKVTQHLATMFQHSLAGLSIEWIGVPGHWHCTGRTIGDLRLRTRTGVSVIAILRGDETLPSPGPETRIDRDDTVVAVGTPEGLQTAIEIFETGATA